MSQILFEKAIVLHAGTSPIVSELTLMLLFVVLGVGLVGIGFGRIVKDKLSLLYHGWIMSIAILINWATIALVMLPTFFRYFLDPDVVLFSSFSLITLIHAVVGVPAVTTSLMYVFGTLPKKTKMWMRLTTLFWIANIAIGIVLFLQMMEII